MCICMHAVDLPVYNIRIAQLKGGENIGRKFTLKGWWGNVWQIIIKIKNTYINDVALEVPEKIQYLKQSAPRSAQPSFYMCVIKYVVVCLNSLKMTIPHPAIEIRGRWKQEEGW